MPRGRRPPHTRPFALRVPPRPARAPRTYDIDPQAHANLRRILRERAQAGPPPIPEETPAMSDYRRLFTADVVAQWWRLYQSGRSLNWIATHNGLHKTTGNTVKQYFVRYGYLDAGEDLRDGQGRAPVAVQPAAGGEALHGQLAAAQQLLDALRAAEPAIEGRVTVRLCLEIAL